MTLDILFLGMPGIFEILIIILIFAIPVTLIIIFSRSLFRSKKENVRLRLEVGKLADELEQIRKKTERDEK